MWQYHSAPTPCSGSLARDAFRRATAWWLSIMGRLKPGWTIARANAQIQTVSPSIMRESLPPSYRADDAKKYLANKLTVTPGASGRFALASSI